MGRSVAGFGVIAGDVATFAGATLYLRGGQQKERLEKLKLFPTAPPAPGSG
jgi:hypothetical protein